MRDALILLAWVALAAIGAKDVALFALGKIPW